MSQHIALTLANPEFSLEKSATSSRGTLTFQDGQTRVAIEFSAAALHALLQQAQALIPQPLAVLPEPEVDAAWRDAAWPLRKLDDQAWRLLMREVQFDPLLEVLWYLKDRDLARKVIKNCSVPAGAMIVDDLVARHQGKDPDQASAQTRQAMRQELTRILDIVYRLADEGQIRGITE